MGQAAAGNLSAPAANAVGATCRAFLAAIESTADERTRLLNEILKELGPATEALAHRDWDTMKPHMVRALDLIRVVRRLEMGLGREQPPGTTVYVAPADTANAAVDPL